MTTPDSELENRLIDLESKLAFSEDLLEELNRLVYRQQQQIELLAGEVRALRDQARHQPQEQRSLRDEIPPHY